MPSLYAVSSSLAPSSGSGSGSNDCGADQSNGTVGISQPCDWSCPICEETCGWTHHNFAFDPSADELGDFGDAAFELAKAFPWLTKQRAICAIYECAVQNAIIFLNSEYDVRVAQRQDDWQEYIDDNCLEDDPASTVYDFDACESSGGSGGPKGLGGNYGWRKGGGGG